jgi:hypothetical protein
MDLISCVNYASAGSSDSFARPAFDRVCPERLTDSLVESSYHVGTACVQEDYAEPLAAFQSGIASLTESGHVGKRDAAMRRGRGEGAQGPGLDVGPSTIAWTPCGLKG